MIYIILGLLVWTAAFAWKYIAGGDREGSAKSDRIIRIAGSAVAIVLIVVGYRCAEVEYLWGRSPAMTGVNNLLVLFAFYLFAASGAKTRITSLIRYPQFVAVLVWAVAHLLVNGDTASVLLFGGLGGWAILQMILMRGVDGPRGAYQPVPAKKEIIAIVATVVAFTVTALIHMWIGPNPFG